MPINPGARASLRVPIVVSTAVLVTALAACDASSAPPDAGSVARQVTVVGHGEVDGTPDTLTANAAVTFAASDVTSAMNQTNERQRAVIDAVVDAGVDRSDIATSNVSLQSQYGADGVTVVGYQASNAITVTVRDLSAASQVLALITSTGGNATRINAVDLSIHDDSQLVKDARTRAFEDARDRARQYAELSGLALGKVLSISEAPGTVAPVPVPMPRGPVADAAMAPTPIEPGQQTVGFDVTAVWELG